MSMEVITLSVFSKEEYHGKYARATSVDLRPT